MLSHRSVARYPIGSILMFSLATLCVINLAISRYESGLRTVMRRNYRIFSPGPVVPNSNLLIELNNRLFEQASARLQIELVKRPENDLIHPVILSAVQRPIPHWLILASQLRSADLTPVVIHRSGAVQSSLIPPFTGDLVTKARERQVFKTVVSTTEDYMPIYDLKGARDVTAEQMVYFLRQLLDHRSAWINCLESKKPYCLVLEDDSLLAKHFHKRLNDALAYLKFTEEGKNVGVLKLFEIDPGCKFEVGMVEGWDKTSIPFIIQFSVIVTIGIYALQTVSLRDISYVSLATYLMVVTSPWYLPIIFWLKAPLVGYVMAATYFLLLAYRISNKSISKIFPRLFVAIYLWTLLMILLLGWVFFHIPPRNKCHYLPSLEKQASSFRNCTYPLRGALANIYQTKDLPELIDDIRQLLKSNLNVAMDHSDRIRADVFVVEYFKKQGKLIKLMEPNIVQHLGFMSMEPRAEYPRIALSSTFEDGSLQ